ncbi:hypothetical protein CspHIS471_0411360 [Cutaneotrichosporon sp. HIS471]|nr:hypothetical protein CspHIS471_0411360 [Cutaneotrichosporon sp. HIS471]
MVGSQTTPTDHLLIDSQVYPHIIDRVIKHADAGVLLAFSFSAKAYRNVYYKHVARHLVMVSGRAPRISITSHRGPLSIPTLPMLKIKALMKRKTEFFKHCTTLDVKDDFASYLQFTLVLPQLKTLRLFLNPSGFRKVLPHLANTSIVLFGVYPFHDTVWSGNDVWYGPTIYLKDKVVWNVTDFYCPEVRSSRRVDLWRVKEFVIYFNISPNARVKNCLLMSITETLIPILQRSVRHPNPLVFKLVGFENLSLENVNFVNSYADSTEERTQLAHSQFDNVANRVLFMTAEEYCAEVGRETFEIETLVLIAASLDLTPLSSLPDPTLGSSKSVREMDIDNEKPPLPEFWIDDSVYPHITDNILRWSSWETLCAFRCTSRPHLARVDALMGEHVVLACDTPPRMNVTSPYGRIPGMRDRHYMDWAKPGGEGNRPALERSKQLMKHTRVVDLIGTGDLSLIPISNSLTGVRVLRVRPDKENIQVYKTRIMAAKTAVFGDVGASPVVFGDFRTVVPAGVNKLVINIRYHPAQDGEVRFPVIIELFPPDLPEVVVYIVEPRWINAHPPWDRERLQRQRWNSMSSSLAGMLLRTRRRDLRITIVGLRSVYPSWVGHHVDSVSQLEGQLLHNVETSLREELRGRRGRDADVEESWERHARDDADDPREWPFPDASTAVQNIVFSTREAYAATLDPYEHLLETAEVLESDKRDPPLREKWPTDEILGFVGN